MLRYMGFVLYITPERTNRETNASYMRCTQSPTTVNMKNRQKKNGSITISNYTNDAQKLNKQKKKFEPDFRKMDLS